MHREGHIESGSGYSSGGGTSSGPRRTNRTPIGSAGTDMGSGMMGNPTMGGGMMMGIVQSDGSTMTPMGLQSSNRNINLPMSSALPINVNENTPNVQQIQSFPVVGTGPNGIHFHQDPITGQMYRMTEEFHNKIQTTTSKSSLFSEAVSNLEQKGIKNIFPNTNVISNEKNIIYTTERQSFINRINPNILIQSQIQNTYTQDQIRTLQEFLIPMNKFSEINPQITSQKVIYNTIVPISKFADVESVSNKMKIVIQTKPIPLTKLV